MFLFALVVRQAKLLVCAGGVFYVVVVYVGDELGNMELLCVAGGVQY